MGQVEVRAAGHHQCVLKVITGCVARLLPSCAAQPRSWSRWLRRARSTLTRCATPSKPEQGPVAVEIAPKAPEPDLGDPKHQDLVHDAGRIALRTLDGSAERVLANDAGDALYHPALELRRWSTRCCVVAARFAEDAIGVQVRPESAFKCRRNGCSGASGIRTLAACPAANFRRWQVR